MSISVTKEKKLPELTIKAFILGIILAVVLTAANAYLGLFAGMTISASIPAAVLSMGILSLFKKSNVLENNIVQTAASTAEALAGAAIFTLPALILMGYWNSFDTWEVAKILGLGGILGVVFTIPLRKVLLNNPDMKFPEGTATALILKAGDNVKRNIGEAGEQGQMKVLLIGGGISALLKLCQQGLSMWSAAIAGGVSIGGAVFGGGVEVAPACISIGYIVGVNVAVILFLGGFITWCVAMPIFSYIHGGFFIGNMKIASSLWNDHLRYLGVGGMIVGGLYSVFQIIKPIIHGVSDSLKAYNVKNSNGGKVAREERDIPIKIGLVILVLAVIPLLLYMFGIVQNFTATIVLCVTLVIASFLFSCVGGYISGLIGSSTSPISGLSIVCILFVSFILLAILGAGSIKGGAAAIILGAIICSSASIATDNMQDLKAGQILGATPWKQQVMLILGTLIASLVVAGVLNVLNGAYHIGSEALPAPQANLMYAVEKGVFHGGLPYLYISIGGAFIFFVILLDRYLASKNCKFKLYPLAMAIGLYIPVMINAAVFLGGIVYALSKLKKDKFNHQRGILLASGIIAGEAIMGILVAVPIFVSGSANWWPKINGFHFCGWLVVLSTMIGLFMISSKKKNNELKKQN